MDVLKKIHVQRMDLEAVYDQLVVFRRGKAEMDEEEYRNGHGSSPMVWNALVNRYGRLLYPDTPLTGVIPQGPMTWLKLIDHWQELPLREWETIVLLWTCDHSITKREDFNRLATALCTFEDAHAVPNQVCHLVQMANRIDELTEDETVEAVALYASCGTNVWFVCEYDDSPHILGKGSPKYRSYDMNRDDQHWFIFEELKEVTRSRNLNKAVEFLKRAK